MILDEKHAKAEQANANAVDMERLRESVSGKHAAQGGGGVDEATESKYEAAREAAKRQKQWIWENRRLQDEPTGGFNLFGSGVKKHPDDPSRLVDYGPNPNPNPDPNPDLNMTLEVYRL